MLKLADLLASAPPPAGRAQARTQRVQERPKVVRQRAVPALTTEDLLEAMDGGPSVYAGQEVRVQGFGKRRGAVGGLRLIVNGRVKYQGPVNQAVHWLKGHLRAGGSASRESEERECPDCDGTGRLGPEYARSARSAWCPRCEGSGVLPEDDEGDDEE